MFGVYMGSFINFPSIPSFSGSIKPSNTKTNTSKPLAASHRATFSLRAHRNPYVKVPTQVIPSSSSHSLKQKKVELIKRDFSTLVEHVTKVSSGKFLAWSELRAAEQDFLRGGELATASGQNLIKILCAYNNAGLNAYKLFDGIKDILLEQNCKKLWSCELDDLESLKNGCFIFGRATSGLLDNVEKLIPLQRTRAIAEQPDSDLPPIGLKRVFSIPQSIVDGESAFEESRETSPQEDAFIEEMDRLVAKTTGFGLEDT